MDSFGKLYIVATPIGNLEDISVRALETLKNSEVILAEDTRELDKISKKYLLNLSSISYTDQKHSDLLEYLINTIQNGKDISLISDSGTPVISDPGFLLVREFRRLNFDVISIPGPSAVISALSISGLPADKFSFLGFMPKSGTKISKILSQYKDIDTTLIIYESPYRLKKTLEVIQKTLGDRTVCIAKDLTRKFESVTISACSDIIRSYNFVNKGAYVILVAKEGYKLYE